jgi:hypothetical protein
MRKGSRNPEPDTLHSFASITTAIGITTAQVRCRIMDSQEVPAWAAGNALRTGAGNGGAGRAGLVAME